MYNTAIFQGLISSRPPDLAQVQRQSMRLRSLFLLYSLLVSLATGAFAWFLLWKLTETDQWEGFWSISSWGVIFLLSVPPIVLLILPAILLVRQGHDAETATRALPLREAARRGDDTTAPLDPQQPTAAESAAWATDPPWRVRLRRADTSAQNHRLMLGGVLSALGSYAQIAHGLTDLMSDFGSVEVVITLALLPFLGVGLVLLLWGLLTPDKMRITVTQEGLEWRQLHAWRPGTRERMSWDEAQAFFAFRYSQLASSTRNPLQHWRIYVLDAPEATLAWKVSDSKPGKPREQADQEQLVEMILTHTRLPLRTLEAAAEDVVKQLGKERWEKDIKTAASASHEAMGLPSSAVLHSRPKRQGVGVRARTLFVLPVLLLLVFPFAVWGVQAAREHYYETLLEQARSHQPLYHDALTGPDSDWAVQAPTANDSDSFSFLNRSYQLTGGFPMEVMAPGFFGDAAVEVTVRPLHWPKADDFQGVGLVLHTVGPYDDQQIVFRIAPDGYWEVGPASQLYDGYDHLRQGGQLNAATSNRLTVIMQGSQYICFVNDTFLGIYQADSPKMGQVGIFAEPYHDVVAFNDFTVYPL